MKNKHTKLLIIILFVLLLLIIGGGITFTATNITPESISTTGTITSSAFSVNSSSVKLDASGITYADGTVQTSAPTGWATSGSNIYNSNAGNVGIGNSNPTEKLHVTGNIKTTACLKYNNGGADANLGTCLDLAELYDTEGILEPGMLASVSEKNGNTLRASKAPYEKSLVGVVSSNPAMLIEGDAVVMGGPKAKGEKTPLALSGRVKAKVSTENGPVQTGDYITSSSTAGVGMKATQAGTVVGKALESWSGKGVGEILILVGTGYYR